MDQEGQGHFFFPQLVTQGSSIHGLSNKLTVELKHACLLFIPEFALSLLSGGKDFGSDRQGLIIISPGAYSSSHLGSMWESHHLCPNIPARAFHYAIDNSNGIIVTSDQMPGTMPGPYVCISFNLNPVR